jgi:trimethylamine-N-oxide reductase (cytochrome c)
MFFSITLWGIAIALRIYAWQSPKLRALMAEKDFVAQIRVKDGSRGRWYRFTGGKLESRSGILENPDVLIRFKTAPLGARMLLHMGSGMFHFAYPFAKLFLDPMEVINAQKNFAFEVQGSEDLALHFTNIFNLMLTDHWRQGTPMPDGEIRYVNQTNGGPVFVYVKNGRIVRITPIEFDEHDAKGWSIDARGQTFTPPHRATISPHGLASKSLIYSEKRLLYPMKRVDFDPNGKRNTQNRGKSGYVRISWDEALDMAANEIKRLRRQYGHGVIFNSHGSHHTWGNVGYYLSANIRFMNSIGYTKMVLNPDSWEGWFWGASHHFGYSMRMGTAEPYGQIEDCLKEAEMIVFWSSDPESSCGSYAAFEATVRRQWAKQLGIKMVHIDPYKNATASWLGGKWIPSFPARVLPWRTQLPMSGLRRVSTTKITWKRAPRASTNTVPTYSAKTTGFQNLPNGRRSKPALKPTSSVHSPASGREKKRTSHVEARASVSVAQTGMRPGSSGRAVWSA